MPTPKDTDLIFSPDAVSWSADDAHVDSLDPSIVPLPADPLPLFVALSLLPPNTLGVS